MNKFDFNAFREEFETHGAKAGLLRFINEKGGIQVGKEQAVQVTRRDIDLALEVLGAEGITRIKCMEKSAKILNHAVDYLELKKKKQREKQAAFEAQLKEVAEKYHALS